MYQRRSNLQNLMILLLDCLTIVVSLILANYIRNGRLFESDDARMDFGLLLGAVLVVFLAMNLFGSLYRNMMLRGPLHECMCVIRNNAISFAGAAVVLYFMGLLDAYSRLVFFYFLYPDADCAPALEKMSAVFVPDFSGEQEDAVGCGRCVRSAARHGYEKL